MNDSKLLYQIVFDSIYGKIVSGAYKGGDMLPSEREIGQLFDVDRTTVRKALQMLVDENLVVKMPGIGTKVLGKNQVHTNQKNEVNSSERKNGGTIGFFLPRSIHRTDRISQPFYSSLFFYTEKEAKNRGYSCHYSTLDESDDFEEILKTTHYEGIIFLSNTSEKFILQAQKAGIPSILVNEFSEHTISFLFDNTKGMMQMCEYLIDLGHKKFALIGGIDSYLTSQERLIGCTYAFVKNSIPQPKYIGTDWEPDTAYEATKDLLLNSDELPTAIVAFNDNIAFGCLRAANELGLRVPQDISVVGFDDIEQSKYSIPRLTTVRANIKALARSAFQGLQMKMDNPECVLKLKCVVPCSLSIRESSAAPPKTPVKINRDKLEINK